MATSLNGIDGGLIKNIAGTDANMKRKDPSNNGWNSIRLSFIKIKLSPQIDATNIANKIWLIGII